MTAAFDVPEPGRNVYGVDIGIVLMPMRFPRPVGDIGNARTFDYPVAYELAPGMTKERMLATDAEGMVEVAAEAARALVDRGVRAVTSSCGMMAKYQAELADAVPVPIAGSSLVQIPLILRLIPRDATLGVVTVDRRSLLDGGHFEGLGLSDDDISRLEVEGLDRDGAIATMIMDGAPLDPEASLQDAVRTVQRMRDRVPKLGAVLLECTNIAPYSRELRRIFGIPVWNAITLVDWLQAGVAGERP